MNTKSFGQYSFPELWDAVNAPGAQQIDIDTLGVWFEVYGNCYWNGEYYQVDRDHRLYRIVEWDEETDCGEIVGYELR